jgi:hypothetical protein
MAPKKTSVISVDIYSGKVSGQFINFTTMDVNTASLSFQVKNQENKLALSNVTPKIFLNMEDGSQFVEDCEIVDATNGVVQYTLKSNEIKHSGRVDAEFYLVYTDSSIGSFNFTFYIKKSAIDTISVPAQEVVISDIETFKASLEARLDDTQATLTSVQLQVTNAQTQADNITNLINQNQVAKQSDVTSLTTQMAERTTDSQGRGINPLFPPAPLVACKGNGSDDTTALQAIINYCQTNNCKLISPTGKTYGVSSPLTITNTLRMDFNFSTIKALNFVDSVINYNTSASDTFIDNLVIDCNNQTNYGVYIYTIQMARMEHLIIINVTKTGFHMRSGYELFVSQLRIQGDGNINTIGIRSYGDSHFNNVNMLDCYTGIYSANYSFFNNIHAWLSGKGPINGSMFMTGTGGGSFDQVYPDTYHYAFAPTSNTNFLNINHCYIYANPTIFTSTLMSDVPYVFYFNSNAEMVMVSITNSSFVPLSATSGINGGGKFSNQPLYLWTGKMHNCMFSGIQFVPDNIVSSLTLGTGWTVGGINRLTKRNGRVHLELDCYYTSNLVAGTSYTIVSFGNGSFPDGFYPKDAKKIAVAVGGSFSIRDICYGYLNASVDHSSLAITYFGAQSVNYVTIDIEYEVVNSI